MENKLFTLERDINDMLKAGGSAFRYVHNRPTCTLLIDRYPSRGGAGQPPRAALSAGGIFLPAEFSAIQLCSEVILFTKINVF